MDTEDAPLIDLDTPWENDARAQYAVACHPEGLTVQQIAELTGLSASEISRIEQRAIRRLPAPQLIDAFETLIDLGSARLRRCAP